MFYYYLWEVAMSNDYIIDFPYLNHMFNRGDFVKNIIFTHLMPYIMEPNFEKIEERKKWQRLAAVKTQKMILDIQDKVKTKNKYKIDAINDVNIKDQTKDYFAYKLEYDFYQKLGGDDAFYNTCIWNDVTNFIKSKAGYLLSIYTVMKLYMDKWDEYNKYKEEEKSKEQNDGNQKSNDNLMKEPSFEDCHQDCADRAKNINDYPFQSYSTKSIKDDIWKEFKNVAHLIYGYVEALVENEVIVLPPETQNKVDYINNKISPILANLDNNSKYLREMLSYALKAQNYRIKHKHSKSVKNVDMWILPEDILKKNYGIKSK